MIIKKFILNVITYLFLSLLLPFSIGYKIDWILEASLAQKIKGCAFKGFTRFCIIKLLIATSIGTGYSFLYLKQRSSSTLKH